MRLSLFSNCQFKQTAGAESPNSMQCRGRFPKQPRSLHNVKVELCTMAPKYKLTLDVPLIVNSNNTNRLQCRGVSPQTACNTGAESPNNAQCRGRFPKQP